MGFLVVLRMFPWALVCSVAGHALLVYFLSSPAKHVNVMKFSVEQGRTNINMRHSKPKLTKKELEVAKKEIPIERDAPKPTPVVQQELPPPTQQALLEKPVKRVEEKPLEEPKPIERKVRPPEVLEVAEMEAPAVAESVARNAAKVVMPTKLYNPAPPYPTDAYNARHTGTVTLRLRVGVDGRVKSATVLVSSGFPSLDASAAFTARTTWRFNPARRSGEVVEFEFKHEVEFRLNESR